jgi:hypothetical protein
VVWGLFTKGDEFRDDELSYSQFVLKLGDIPENANDGSDDDEERCYFLHTSMCLSFAGFKALPSLSARPEKALVPKP